MGKIAQFSAPSFYQKSMVLGLLAVSPLESDLKNLGRFGYNRLALHTITLLMKLKVYGIPNCGTCKKALQWLDGNEMDYEFIDTKQQPPTIDQIRAWVQTLGNKPLRNTSGQSYRSLGADRETWSDEQWVAAFAQDAMLLKRPLFVRADRALMTGFRGKDAEIRSILET
jgi:arsenate reductase (glutaredoxin)